MCRDLIGIRCSWELCGEHLSAATEKHQSGHKQQSGIVTEKAGALVIKTEEGTTYQLNENRNDAMAMLPSRQETMSRLFWTKTTR